MIDVVKYLKNSAHCPYCHSSNIESKGIEPASLTTAVDEVICQRCGAMWDDLYTLTGAREISSSENTNGDLANDDKFECASCNRVFDNDDSHEVGGVLLCGGCANK